MEQKTLDGMPLTAIYDTCVQTGLPVTKRDVINIQVGMRIRRLNGLSPMQALLMRLEIALITAITMSVSTATLRAF